MKHEIIMNSTNDCLKLIENKNTDFSSFSPKERYEIFVARTYFVSHYDEFSKDEKDKFFSHPAMVQNIPKNIALDFLQKCIDDKVLAPFILNSWFKESNSLLSQYLGIAVEKDNLEQIKTLIEKTPKICFDYYMKCSQHTDNFTNSILINYPVAILFNNHWSEEKIIQVLEDNPHYAPISVQQYVQGKINTDIHLKENGLNTFLSIYANFLVNECNKDPQAEHKNLSYLKDVFVHMPSELVGIVKEKSSEFFNRFLLQTITENHDQLNFKPSLLQVIFIEKILKEKDIKELLNFNVLAPVTTEVNLFEYHMSFYEYLLHSDQLLAFRGIPRSEFKTEKDKKMFAAAAIAQFNRVTNLADFPQELKKEAMDLCDEIEHDVLANCLPGIKDDINEKTYDILRKMLLNKKLHLSLKHKRTGQYKKI